MYHARWKEIAKEKRTPRTTPKETLRLNFGELDLVLFRGSALDQTADVLINPTTETLQPGGRFDKLVAREGGPDLQEL